jgi:hypothetical protein
MVDEYILYDDVQYTKRDWRNRNRIKTRDGAKWLTIPVMVKGGYTQKIKETQIADSKWPRKHWATIRHAYSAAPFFPDYKELFEDLYLSNNETYLSRVNYRFLRALQKLLQIETKVTWSMDYQLKASDKTERLVELCVQAGATEYLSGPKAIDYLDKDLFHQEGIKVTFVEFNGYPAYNQLYPPFDHYVSVVDLIFNMGDQANKCMNSFRCYA